MTGMATVHLVDDEAMVRASTCLLLQPHGYAVALYRDGAEFLAAGPPAMPGVALFDMRMPGLDGLELIAAIRARAWRVPVILTSGHIDPTLGVRALRAGAADVIEKPYPEHLLLDAIAQALATAQG